MSQKDIRGIILDQFSTKDNLKNLAENDDFFDAGISSLTMIDLQIKIEEILEVSIPTSELMKLFTIGGWIRAYQSQCSKLASAD